MAKLLEVRAENEMTWRTRFICELSFSSFFLHEKLYRDWNSMNCLIHDKWHERTLVASTNVQKDKIMQTDVLFPRWSDTYDNTSTSGMAKWDNISKIGLNYESTACCIYMYSWSVVCKWKICIYISVQFQTTCMPSWIFVCDLACHLALSLISLSSSG